MSAFPGYHSLFVYDDDDEFVDRLGSFLGAATAAGEAALAAVGERKWELLRAALGDASQRISHLNNEAVYRRPEAAMATYDAILRGLEREGAPAVRAVGEFPVTQAPAEQDAWVIYEAVLNRALARYPATIICGYDLREQPAHAVEGARHTHRMILGDAWEDNPRYEDAAEVVAALTPQPQLLPGLRQLPVDDDATAFRARLQGELAALGVPASRLGDMLVAAGKVFENARSHGAGVRAQRLGRVGEQVVWELADNGPGFTDPLAGYIPPRGENGDATGLWVARQLTERVEFMPSAGGFTTRLWF